MLNPDAVDGMAEAIANIYSDAEQQLIARISRSLAKGAGSPEWASLQLLEVYRLAELARGDLFALNPTVQAQLEAFIAQAAAAGQAAASVDLAAAAAVESTKVATATGAAAQAAAATGAAMSATPVIAQAAVQALAAETVGVITGMHAPILRNIQDQYRGIVAEVAGRTVTGSATTHQILQQSLNRFADQGITGFVDRGGRRWRIDSYAEMATRTATMRALQAGHTAKLMSAGRDLVVISSHANSAPQCAPYQGKIVSLSGSTSGTVEMTNRLTGEPMQVSVFASMREAESNGLHHPNCGHRHTLYVPGAPRPQPEPYDPEKYRNEQKLRYHERQVRAAKRRVAAAEGMDDPQEIAHANALLRARQARLRDHVANTGTPRRRYREQLRIGKPGDTGPATRVTRRPPPDPTPSGARAPKPPPGPVDDVSDLDELGARAAAAIEAEDFDLLDAIDAREQVVRAQIAAREARNAAARDKRARAAAAKRAEQEAEYDRLVAGGMDVESAWGTAFGISADQQRRQDAISRLRGDGHDGAGFDELSRNAYADVVHDEWLAAENELTFLVRREYASDVDPRELWKVNETTARKWATPELLEWWDQHGRTTLDGFRAGLLGGTQSRTSGGDFYQ